MKNVFTMGKLMINVVFVNCPRVKNKLFHFTIDNIFFRSTYQLARYFRKNIQFLYFEDTVLRTETFQRFSTCLMPSLDALKNITIKNEFLHFSKRHTHLYKMLMKILPASPESLFRKCVIAKVICNTTVDKYFFSNKFISSFSKNF